MAQNVEKQRPINEKQFIYKNKMECEAHKYAVNAHNLFKWQNKTVFFPLGRTEMVLQSDFCWLQSERLCLPWQIPSPPLCSPPLFLIKATNKAFAGHWAATIDSRAIISPGQPGMQGEECHAEADWHTTSNAGFSLHDLLVLVAAGEAPCCCCTWSRFCSVSSYQFSAIISDSVLTKKFEVYFKVLNFKAIQNGFLHIPEFFAICLSTLQNWKNESSPHLFPSGCTLKNVLKLMIMKT